MIFGKGYRTTRPETIKRFAYFPVRLSRSGRWVWWEDYYETIQGDGTYWYTLSA